MRGEASDGRGLKESGSEVYVLETGDCGAARLQMQDEIYGSSTRQMMLDAGLCAGIRVLDLACGRGIMSHWIAKQVEPRGTVVGGDISRDRNDLWMRFVRCTGC
jgi:2-polyprenyl-3-methyl-5-hydroxy-6-metoxy-1,4-benzoquinol methylase